MIGRYVTLDPNDNSVTFSKALVRVLRRRTDKDLRVYTGKVSGSEDYLFIVAPSENMKLEGFPMPTIQQDGRTLEYGYNSYNPSVASMVYNWGLEHDKQVKARVSSKWMGTDWVYIIHKP